jgi:hypothetical protein
MFVHKVLLCAISNQNEELARHQSVQNAESLSNFSCIPSVDLDNKTMSSAYIKQWIEELSKMTGSFVV